MKYIIILFFLSAMSGFTQTQKKKSVAVIEFQSSGMEHGEASTLTNRFRGMLVETDVFNVVEQDKMNELLKAQDFILSDNCNSAECAVQVGQLLGVEQMIGGNIGKVGKTWTIDLRLIDVTTSKILKSKSQNYRGDIDGLIDIMTDIAYSFAGKTNPHPSVNLTVTAGSSKPGPIRLDAQGGFGEHGLWLGAGLGFVISSKLKLAVAVSATGNGTNINQPGEKGLAGIEALLIDASWYFRTDDFRPFVSVGAGRARLAYDIVPVTGGTGTDSRKSGVFSLGLGFEVSFSRLVGLTLAGKYVGASGESYKALHGGLYLSLGN